MPINVPGSQSPTVPEYRAEMSMPEEHPAPPPPPSLPEENVTSHAVEGPEYVAERNAALVGFPDLDPSAAVGGTPDMATFDDDLAEDVAALEGATSVRIDGVKLNLGIPGMTPSPLDPDSKEARYAADFDARLKNERQAEALLNRARLMYETGKYSEEDIRDSVAYAAALNTTPDAIIDRIGTLRTQMGGMQVAGAAGEGKTWVDWKKVATQYPILTSIIQEGPLQAQLAARHFQEMTAIEEWVTGKRGPSTFDQYGVETPGPLLRESALQRSATTIANSLLGMGGAAVRGAANFIPEGDTTDWLRRKGKAIQAEAVNPIYDQSTPQGMLAGTINGAIFIGGNLGATYAGAAAGSALLPGVGTAAGAVGGFLADMAFNVLMGSSDLEDRLMTIEGMDEEKARLYSFLGSAAGTVFAQGGAKALGAIGTGTKNQAIKMAQRYGLEFGEETFKALAKPTWTGIAKTFIEKEYHAAATMLGMSALNAATYQIGRLDVTGEFDGSAIIKEALEGSLRAMEDFAIISAVQGGRSYMKDMATYRAVVKDRAAFEALVQGVEGTKVDEGVLRQTLRQIIERAGKKETTWIDRDAFDALAASEGKAPEEIAKELEAEKSYAEGGDVAVKSEIVGAKLVASGKMRKPLGKEGMLLADALRWTENGLSLVKASKEVSKVKSEVERQYTEKRYIPEKDAEMAPAQAVMDDIVWALRKLGHSDVEAKATGKVIADFWAATAAKTGMMKDDAVNWDAYGLWTRNPLLVKYSLGDQAGLATYLSPHLRKMVINPHTESNSTADIVDTSTLEVSPSVKQPHFQPVGKDQVGLHLYGEKAEYSPVGVWGIQGNILLVSPEVAAKTASNSTVLAAIAKTLATTDAPGKVTKLSEAEFRKILANADKKGTKLPEGKVWVAKPGLDNFPAGSKGPRFQTDETNPVQGRWMSIKEVRDEILQQSLRDQGSSTSTSSPSAGYLYSTPSSRVGLNIDKDGTVYNVNSYMRLGDSAHSGGVAFHELVHHAHEALDNIVASLKDRVPPMLEADYRELNSWLGMPTHDSIGQPLSPYHLSQLAIGSGVLRFRDPLNTAMTWADFKKLVPNAPDLEVTGDLDEPMLLRQLHTNRAAGMEKLAYAFQHFIHTGKAPTKELERPFALLADYSRNHFQSVTLRSAALLYDRGIGEYEIRPDANAQDMMSIIPWDVREQQAEWENEVNALRQEGWSEGDIDNQMGPSPLSLAGYDSGSMAEQPVSLYTVGKNETFSAKPGERGYIPEEQIWGKPGEVQAAFTRFFSATEALIGVGAKARGSIFSVVPDSGGEQRFTGQANAYDVNGRAGVETILRGQQIDLAAMIQEELDKPGDDAGRKGVQPLPKDISFRHRINEHTGSVKIEAIDGNGEVVGSAMFGKKPTGEMVSGVTWVLEERQRQGIASAMYDKVAEITGQKVVPAKVRTEDGVAFWTSREPSPVVAALRLAEREAAVEFVKGSKMEKAVKARAEEVTAKPETPEEMAKKLDERSMKVTERLALRQIEQERAEAKESAALKAFTDLMKSLGLPVDKVDPTKAMYPLRDMEGRAIFDQYKQDFLTAKEVREVAQRRATDAARGLTKLESDQARLDRIKLLQAMAQAQGPAEMGAAREHIIKLMKDAQDKVTSKGDPAGNKRAVADEIRREREAFTAEVEQEMGKDKFVQAMVAVGGDRRHLPEAVRGTIEAIEAAGIQFRLDYLQVKERFGKEVADRLPDYFFAKGRKEKRTSVTPDEMAAVFGVDAADLIGKAVELRSFKEYREGQVQRKMLERYGEILTNPEVLMEHALVATFNTDEAIRSAIGQLEAIRDAIGKEGSHPEIMAMERLTPEILAKKAMDMVSGDKVVGRLQPGNLAKAQERAWKAAFEAAVAGDLKGAYEAKQKQVWLAVYVKAAEEMRSKLDAIRTDLEGRQSRKAHRAVLGKGDPMLREIHDGLLEILGLREPDAGVPSTAADILPNLYRLEDYAKNQQSSLGFDMASVEKLLKDISAANATKNDGSRWTNWSKLTVDQAMLVDTITTQLTHFAKMEKSVRVKGQEQDISNIREAIKADIKAKNLPELKSGFKKLSTDNTTFFGDAARLFQSIDGNLTEAESMLGFLSETLRDTVMTDFRESRGRRDRLAEQVFGWWKKNWMEMPKEIRDRSMEPVDFTKYNLDIKGDPKRTVDEPIDLNPTRMTVMMMALHMGNPENGLRLLKGYGWKQADVLKVIGDTLSKQELDFVQSTWDFFDKALWPLVRDKAERQSGLPLRKVQAAPLTIKMADGSTVTLKGGYFPAKYNRALAVNAATMHATEADLGYFYKGNYERQMPSTLKSNQKERTPGYYDRLNLNFSILSGNLVQVVHDIAFDEFVQNTGKILIDKDIENLGITHLGEKRWNNVRAWLWGVANGWVDNVPEHQADLVKKFNKLRDRTVIGILGHNIGVALGDTTNVAVAVAAGRISPYWAAKVTKDIAAAKATDIKNKVTGASQNGLDAWYENLQVESDVVKSRGTHWVLELRKQMLDPLHGKTLVQAAAGMIPDQSRLAEPAKAAAQKYADANRAIRDSAFWLQEKVDKYSTVIIYEAAKQQALADGQSPERAKRLAEKAVEDTLPPLENMSKPSFLRDQNIISSLLLFHGYFNKLGNILRADFHEKVYEPLQAAKAGEIGWGFGKTTDANGTVSDNFGRSTAKFAGESVAIFLMTNVVAEWLSGRGKDKYETLEQYLTRKMLAAPFSVVPFAQPWAEAGADYVAPKIMDAVGLPSHQRSLGGANKVSFRQAPQLALLENIGKLGAQAMSSNRPMDKRIFDGLEAYLYANGLPARQWRRSGQYAWDAVSGQRPPEDPLDVLSGLSYGERPKQPANLFSMGKY